MVLYELEAAGKGNKSGLMFLFPLKSRPLEQLHVRNSTLKTVLFGKPEQNKIFDYRLGPG